MLNTNQFPETIQSMREKFAAQKLEEKRKTNPQAQLSDAEYAEIENILLATVMEMIHNDKPAAAPEKMVKLYKTAVPDIDLVPEAEQTARREKQIKAATAYAKGLMEYNRYVSGYGDFTRDRAEIRLCRTFTPEEMARYVELHDERGAATDDKEVQRIIFGAIKRVVDEYEEILSRDLSDDEIIERFPDLALKFSIITEGHAMMEKIMKHEYDEYSKELLKQYDKKIVGLMPRVSLTQKKIALIADPNYQYIKLEKILDADPNKLHELNDNMEEELSEVGLKTVNVALEEEDDGLQPIDVKDNVLGLASDISFGKIQLLANQIADSLGITYEEMMDGMLISDSQGNTTALTDVKLARQLSELGEIYVVSKYDDKAPVPVFLDKTKDVYTPVVGYAAAKDAPFMEAVEPHQPSGFFAAIANWWSNLVSGEPSQAMKDYQAAKVKYEESMAYASMLKTIKENRVPKAVQDRLDKVAEFNKKCAEDDQNLRDEVVETAIFLNQIPEDKLTNEIFCNALATMLVDKALLDRDEFGFRNRMFEMIDPLADDFDREKAIEKLANSERFAEFAWDLRRKDPELAANLGSDDAEDIEESLDEISDRFLKVFRYSNAMTGSAGAEYEIEKKRLEEISDKGSKLVDGDILKPNEYARMKESFDNKAQWDSIIAFYGSKRPFHPEWTKFGKGNVYNVKDWSYMQGSDFDLAELTPDGKEIDEHTFASLGMMLSIKHPDFFKDNPDFDNLPSAPDSMSFEDIILNGDYPRANNRVIIHPIVEPVRGMLMDDLDDFDGYGKEDLANHLAEKLKLFIGHADHFSWTDRKHGVFAEVADNVMKFVKEHDMLDMLKSAGLEDTDIEKIETFIAMGKVVKDGFDAECRLMQDHKKDPALTAEQRKECLDKIMLLKALQADVGASQKEIEVVEPKRPVRPKTEDPAALAEYEKQREAWKKEYQVFQHNLNKQMTDGTLSTFEFSPIAKDIPNGGTFLKDLADRMMPEEQRIKLAKEGTVAIVDKVQAKGDDALSGKWTKYLKENVAEENRRRMDIRTGQLNKGAEVHKNEPAAKAGEPHLENAKPEVQKSDAGMGLGK